MTSLPPDCAAQLDPLVYIGTDTGTTVETPRPMSKATSARGIVACYGHTHAKTVRNVIGQALYTVNVWLQWCTNEGVVQGPFDTSYWVDIQNGYWSWEDTQVIRYLGWNGPSIQTWIVAYMYSSQEGNRSTHNSMCGKVDGYISYNNDCS